MSENDKSDLCEAYIQIEVAGLDKSKKITVSTHAPTIKEAFELMKSIKKEFAEYE